MTTPGVLTGFHHTRAQTPVLILVPGDSVRLRILPLAADIRQYHPECESEPASSLETAAFILLKLDHRLAGEHTLSMFDFAVIALMLPGLLFLIGIVSTLLLKSREVTRVHREGICDQCGYNLTGNTSGVCPECGLGFKNPTP